MFSFNIDKKISNALGRAGVIHTPHGDIETPAFIVVGTKATVKALTPETVASTGAQSVLANTYHLFLQPGDDIVAQAGGLHTFMNWSGPIFTDSGGFQVFSLGEAYGKGGVGKVAKGEIPLSLAPEGEPAPLHRGAKENSSTSSLCIIDEDGVTFSSHLDGSKKRLTPERSMEIQYNLGADIIFAFDECTSPHATREYQKEALERTHRWAGRCIDRHAELQSSIPLSLASAAADEPAPLKRGEQIENENSIVSPIFRGDVHSGGQRGMRAYQALFGVVQGGRFEDLRRLSARTLANMNFDGFGIGGSFTKDDIGTAVRWVNEELPEDKPRHMLGIGEPLDMFLAIENGCDTFDCVIPTRLARHGHAYTRHGIINLRNAKFRTDFTPLDPLTPSHTSTHYTRAYLSHLYHAHEMLAATLVSEHNVYFLVNLVKEIRQSILEGRFYEVKEEFVNNWK